MELVVSFTTTIPGIAVVYFRPHSSPFPKADAFFKLFLCRFFTD